MDQELKNLFSKGIKGLIWGCLAVILFSPLYVSSTLFFPFITSKNFAFQIAVEVMVVAFLFLCLVDKKYRLHTNLTIVLLGAYLVILTVASIFSGNDFFHSFWSNNERSDGILLLGHLLLFAWVLTSFFRSIKDWYYLFDMFLAACFAVALIAVDQYLALNFSDFWSDHFVPSSNGQRLASTLGNAGYVGGFMVFGLFLSLFMAFKRAKGFFEKQYWWLLLPEFLVLIFVALLNSFNGNQNTPAQVASYLMLAILIVGAQALAFSLSRYNFHRIYYAIMGVTYLLIIMQAQTRGAYLALALGGLITLIYLMWFYWNNLYLKIALVIILISGLLGVVGIFYFKDADFVKSSQILRRISSISISDGTANNRLVTWKMGYDGVKEKWLLGYGQENFYQVFDKYYTPRNTEQWFDRCHNMICDRAVTGGIIGLISYLALLLVPFWAIWFYYIKRYKNNIEIQEIPARRYLTPIIFSIIIITYIIQNLFIFEALVTYIPLVFILSFVGVFSVAWDWDFWDNKNLKISLAGIGLIVFFPSLLIFNLQPMSVNADFIKVLSSESSLDNRIQGFESIMARNSVANQEYRKHYFSFFENILSNYLSNPQNRTADNDRRMAEFASKVEIQLENQISENPYSVANNLQLLRFYNLAYIFNVGRLSKAVDFAPKVIALSPGRPQVYFEVATTHYYLAGYLMTTNQEAEAKKEFDASLSWFYEGVLKYENVNNIGSGQFVNFMLALKSANNNALIADVFVENKNISEIVDHLAGWAISDVPGEEDDAEVTLKKSQVKDIISWLLVADPKNYEFKSALELIK